MIRSNRTLVALVALVAIGLSVSAVGAAAGPAGQAAGSADAAQVSNSSAVDAEDLSIDAYNDGTYTVAQGERCVPIEPLGDGYQTADQYYDYRHPETSPSSYMYSSHGTTHLQEANASRFFLHDGGNGLSLMLVHGELEGTGDGGSTTMVFDDLPAGGEWTVTDDQYDLGNGSESDDVWDTRADASRISWAWSEGRTDGGAYTGLGDDFAITIQPHFNGAADLQLYDGTVEDWQVLSGDERNPQVTSFDMDEPIEIRTGACSAVTDVEIGETADNSTAINAVVTNDGTAEETVTVPIAIDGDVVDEREVTVGSNEAVSINASVELRDAAAVSVGSQVAQVPDDTDDVDDGDSFAEGLPGFGVLVALVAIATALVVGRRR